MSSEEPARARAYYQALYRNALEPWRYGGRASELLRHERIAEEAKGVCGYAESALDIGCSQGQLTRRLGALARRLYAFDVSFEAVERARKNCPGEATRFLLGALPGMPFRDGSFDLIVAADAVNEFAGERGRGTAIAEIRRKLRVGGVALFTDYLRPERFAGFLEEIRRANLDIVRVVPLYDRMWYQFESWFKSVRGWKWPQALLASRALARLLMLSSHLYGSRGSMHFIVIARKGKEKG